MIAEVDAALEALVRRDAVNGARVDVLFDAPNKDWVARRNAPTIDLYLYDIREDLPRRQLAMEPVRNASSGHVTERRLPARRFRLSYLVTAWTQRPEDEHRLLSACLTTLARNEFIPFDLVDGSLAISPYPVLLTVCLPPPQDRSIADVWSALGGELKPSLDLVATAPLDLAWTQPVGAPILEEPLLGLGGPIKIWRSRVVETATPPSETGYIRTESGRMVVTCGSGLLEVLELQVPGRQRLPAHEFLLGRAFEGAFD